MTAIPNCLICGCAEPAEAETRLLLAGSDEERVIWLCSRHYSLAVASEAGVRLVGRGDCYEFQPAAPDVDERAERQ